MLSSSSFLYSSILLIVLLEGVKAIYYSILDTLYSLSLYYTYTIVLLGKYYNILIYLYYLDSF